MIVTIVALGAASSGGAGLRESHATGRLQVTASIGSGAFAHLWTAPVRGGGQCYFLTVDRLGAAQAHASVAPASCTRVDHLPPTVENRLAYTINGPDRVCLPGATDCGAQGLTVIYGEIEALSPVARVAALGPGALRPVAIRGHWFVSKLPSLAKYKRWRLVAYSRGGKILGRIYF